MAKNPNMVFSRIIPGAFYRGMTPGGFQDVSTNIKIPGPIVNIDENTRVIDGIKSMPDPVQLPHVKIVSELDAKSGARKDTEVAFDRSDSGAIHEALNMALSVGLIEHVSDEEVQSRYPEVWKNRREHYIFSNEKKEQKPMGELLDDFFAAKDIEKAGQAKSVIAKAKTETIAAEAAAAVSEPPRPPGT